MNRNIIPHTHRLQREERSGIKQHAPAVLWFTGLSGSGKSTLANEVECVLNRELHVHTYLLDGDNIRTGLNNDLGFSDKDRAENIRRIGEVARLFFDAGLIVLTAFISPFRADRQFVRGLLPEKGFIEIYVRCPVETCEQRDPKGLYQKARRGEIADFTGISSPYEEPERPEMIIDTAAHGVSECAYQVVAYLQENGILYGDSHSTETDNKRS